MKTIGEQIMAYAQGRKTFTLEDIRADLPINPKSISGALNQLMQSDALIPVEKGVYRAANRQIEQSLMRLVLFGAHARHRQEVPHGR